MPELRKTKHILAYLEILPSTCNISDPENLTKVHQLYQKANIFITSMMSVVPHPSFSVKIFANNLIFADEVAYHPDEDNEDLIKHSPERSLIALCYFVSYFQYQALLEYGWLIRGAVTCGSLYLTQTSSAQHIRKSGQNENSEVDFIWGGAQRLAGIWRRRFHSMYEFFNPLFRIMGQSIQNLYIMRIHTMR